MDRKLYRTLLMFAATVLVVWGFLTVLSPFFIAIAWALCLAAISYKPYLALAKRWRKPRFAAFVMVLLTILIVLVPAGMAFYFAGGELVELGSTGLKTWVEDLKHELPKIYAWLNERATRVGFKDVDAAGEQIAGDLHKILLTPISSLAKGARDLLFGLFTFLMSVAVIFVTQYFVYTESSKLRRVVMDLSPWSDGDTDRVLHTLRDNTSAAVLGGILVALIQGALGGIGFAIMGIGAPVLWGIVMALFSLLPFGGAAIVWMPVAIYCLLAGETGSGIFLLSWGLLVVGTIDNLLRPWILRRTGSAVHPMMLFFGILSGIGLFGMSGIVFGPLLVALLVTTMDIYREHKRQLDAAVGAEEPAEA